MREPLARLLSTLFALAIVAVLIVTFARPQKVAAQPPPTPMSNAVVIFGCYNQNGTTAPFVPTNFTKSANAPTSIATDCAQMTADYLDAGFTIQSPDLVGDFSGYWIRTMVR